VSPTSNLEHCTLCDTCSVWQQRRREQIPCGNTDKIEEKDPKGRPPERTSTAQRRARARTRERRQDIDGEEDGAARAVAGAKRARRKQTKKRDEMVTPGPNRGGYLGKDSRPIARNPKYGEAGASPVRGISTGLSPLPIATPPPGQDLAVTREQGHMPGRVCRASVRGRQRVGARWGRPSDADPWGRARGQHATAGRTHRLAAAGDDEDGGSGGSTQGGQRRGRAAGAGGWRGSGKRRRWPTLRRPHGTR